jgi:hypothetical protein
MVQLDTDAALEAILNAGIAHRETIHEWPLSCVQKLCLDNNVKYAYKSQLPPTVEPEFYEKAVSALLPGHSILGRLGECVTMLLQWIDAPSLRGFANNEELMVHSKKVIEQIGGIRGSVPVYLDIGTDTAWLAAVSDTLEKLGTLLGDGRMKLEDSGVIKYFRNWAESAGVLSALSQNSRVIHGDFRAEQIFVTEDGYRVIDWQRPVLAPAEVDLVSLLVDRHISPYGIIDNPVIGIFWFLRLHWVVVAQHDLFPQKHWPVYSQLASEALNQILLCRTR